MLARKGKERRGGGGGGGGRVEVLRESGEKTEAKPVVDLSCAIFQLQQAIP